MHLSASVKHKARPARKQDIVTLADLAPRHRVTGGSERRVFGTDSNPRAIEANATATKKSTKDLPVGKDIKGGKLAGNDSLTLVRG
jgi:hypothetical protein